MNGDKMEEKDAIAARLTQAILYGKSPGIEAESGTGRTHLYVSELSNCIRQTYYKVTGAAPDEEADDNGPASFIMSFGNSFESLVSERFAELGIPRSKLRRGDRKLNLSGETDPLIRFEDKLIITECKATHRANYEVIIDKLLRYNEYPSNYYDQLQMYLWLTPKVDLGVLIIGNRDMRYKDKTPPFIIIPVERDSVWKGKNYARVNELNDAIDKSQEPRREFTPKDWQCRVCPYFKRCYDGEDILATKSNSGNGGISQQ